MYMLVDNSPKGVNFWNCIKSNLFSCSFTIPPFIQQLLRSKYFRGWKYSENKTGKVKVPAPAGLTF